MLSTIGATSVIVPIVARQPTCDALAPPINCSDRSPPDCGVVKQASNIYPY